MSQLNVHTVRVAFTREKQPKDYEKSKPEIEFSGNFEEGTTGADHIEAGKRLMLDACTVVYNALGMDVPTAVAKKLAEGSSSDDGQAKAEKKTEAKKAEPKKEEKKADEKKAKKDDDGDIPDDDGSSKKRTPPPEGKKADSKKTDDGDIPDDDAPKADSKKADDDSDIPDDDAPKGRAISDSPEDRKPDDEDSDIPDGDGDAEDEGDDLSNDALFSLVQSKVGAKQINSNGIKEILAGFNATRVSELPDDKRAEFKEQLELACQK